MNLKLEFSNYCLICVLICAVIANCPDEIQIEPCYCEQRAIICNDNSTIDFEDIFRKLSRTLYEKDKHFDAFYLDNTLNKELAENIFKDITFDEIHISNCEHLKTINENAFTETEKVTKIITMENCTTLDSQGKSLFITLSKFVNVEQILLKYLNVEEIPTNAFKPFFSYQDNLKYLAFIGPSFKRLENRAFSFLRKLERLTFWDTSISWIPEHAFEFESFSTEPLLIWFNSNKWIKSSSFHRNSLSNINRVARIEFAFHGSNLDELDERTFKPFIDKNSQNVIDLGYKEFDCTGCHNYWIIREKNPDNSSKLLPQIKNFRCSNGKDLLDIRNFVRCR